MMNSEELTKTVLGLAAAGNIHPVIILADLALLLSGGDNKVYAEMTKGVHEVLVEKENTIPWKIGPYAGEE